MQDTHGKNKPQYSISDSVDFSDENSELVLTYKVFQYHFQKDVFRQTLQNNYNLARILQVDINLARILQVDINLASYINLAKTWQVDALTCKFLQDCLPGSRKMCNFSQPGYSLTSATPRNTRLDPWHSSACRHTFKVTSALS